MEHYPAVLSLSLVTSAVMVADVPSTNTLIPTHTTQALLQWTLDIHRYDRIDKNLIKKMRIVRGLNVAAAISVSCIW